MTHTPTLLSILFLSVIIQCVNAGTCYESGHILSEPTGVISDHLGFGNYQDQDICTWTIYPSGSFTSLTIIFEKLDLEYDFDFIRIVDSSHRTVANISGWILPDPIELSASFPVTVYFFTDQLLTATGFRLRYSANNCSQPVGGNGYCVGSTYVCRQGWQGDNCNTAVCSNNCNGNGQCLTNGTCTCNDDHLGVACQYEEPTYCSAETSLSGVKGSFVDHKFNGMEEGVTYLPGTNCTWKIDTGLQSPVTIWFPRIQIQDFYDVIYFYDDLHRRVASVSSSGFPIPPFKISSGNFTVNFLSTNDHVYSGFEMEWSSISLCPSSCSNQGNCVRNRCVCDGGWTGDDCSIAAVATPLTENVLVSAIVTDGEWRYFSIDVPSAPRMLTVYYNQVAYNFSRPFWQGGSTDFYLQRGKFPTQSSKIGTGVYWFPTRTMTVGDPDGIYYVGVFAKEAANVTLSWTVGSSPDTSQDTNEDTQAETSSGSHPKKSTSGSWFLWISVGVVIGIFVVVMIVSAYLYQRKKNRATAFRKVAEMQEVPTLQVE